MKYYVFWCRHCIINTPHASWSRALDWWDTRCICCNNREIISL